MKKLQYLKNQYLSPKHPIMSLVRVDLLCLVKARDAAFLRRPDAAMHPNMAGFSERLKIFGERQKQNEKKKISIKHMMKEISNNLS